MISNRCRFAGSSARIEDAYQHVGPCLRARWPLVSTARIPRATSLLDSVNFPADCPIQRWTLLATGRSLILLPLFGRLALCAPGVYLGDLGLQRRVHQPVSLESVLAGEFGGDYESCKGLAAAACGREAVSPGYPDQP